MKTAYTLFKEGRFGFRMYFIAILCIMGALLVSRCSGTELSNYGSKAHLIISGNVYKITNPLNVIGIGCGDLDLSYYLFPHNMSRKHEILSRIIPSKRIELFTLFFNKQNKAFELEARCNDEASEDDVSTVYEEISISLFRNAEELDILNRGSVSLRSEDVLRVGVGESMLELIFRYGYGNE